MEKTTSAALASITARKDVLPGYAPRVTDPVDQNPSEEAAISQREPRPRYHDAPREPRPRDGRRACAGRACTAPHRVVHCGDGIAWLRAASLPSDAAIVTSLPDHSETPERTFDEWRSWFVETVELACRAAADDAVAVFYQTDVKRDGRWIDKGFLVQLGAERAASALLWHRIVCRVPPGTTTFGRPAYAHLLCVSRSLRLAPGQSSPDVLPRLGEMTWSRAMGKDACESVAAFLLAHTSCRSVVDPFCGVGTMLAVANEHGLDAVGVERSRKRAEVARALTSFQGKLV